MKTLARFLLILFPACVFAAAAHEHAASGEEARVAVEIPAEQQARIGVGFSEVEKKAIRHTVRTVGAVKTDQSREAHVHLRVSGWIEEVFADYVGKTVRAGDPLFSLYSPELVTAQGELLAALRVGGVSGAIAKTVRERLEFLGMPEEEIGVLVKERALRRRVTFRSPVDGYVVSKVAVKGMYVTPNTELYYVADISKVWIQATLYESDVALTEVGNRAEITVTYDPGTTLAGRVDFISPEIDPVTRTAQARIRVDNAGFKLKPGMFADVRIAHDLGERIVIPPDSVIDTGARRIVFVKTAATRFEPREVKLGVRADEGFVILEGLKVGEAVVTRANFLIDAESKIQAVSRRDGAKKVPGHGGH